MESVISDLILSKRECLLSFFWDVLEHDSKIPSSKFVLLTYGHPWDLLGQGWESFLSGTVIQWLSWTATWTRPLWAPPKSRDVLEEYSPELMVSHKFWDLRDLSGIKGLEGAKWWAGSFHPMNIHAHSWLCSPWMLGHSHNSVCNFCQKCLQCCISIMKHSTSDHCGSGWDSVKD